MTIHASWKKGYHSKVDATIAYKEVEKIRKKNKGEITPENVILSAKAATSPIHDVFEWSNVKAAKEYRLTQARKMTAAIEIIREELPARPTRAFEITRIKTPEGKKPTRKVYKTTEDILEDPVSRDELLGRAIREAISYRKKYHMLSELAQIFTAMDDVVSNADKMIA